MAKIKITQDINMRTKTEIIDIPKNSYVEVTEDMAIYFCKEDAGNENRRMKKAIRTTEDELNEIHLDYKHI